MIQYKKLIRLLPLTLILFMFIIPSVHADSTFYSWPISMAVNGENTNCNNFWNSLATTTSVSATYFNNDGIRTANNSWAGKTLSSATLYIMRLTGHSGGGIVTFGSFNSASGTLIRSLATVSYASLPVCVASAPVSTTFTGLNYVIPSGAYLGWSYSGAVQDGVVDYFDYRSGAGGSAVLPNVTEYFLQCGPSPPGSCTTFSTSVFSPFFGSFSQTTPPGPPGPPVGVNTPPVSTPPSGLLSSHVVEVLLGVLAIAFIVYSAWEAEQDDFK
jgi:hypothetical protein